MAEHLFELNRRWLAEGVCDDAMALRKRGERLGLKLPPWFLGSLRAAAKLEHKHPRGKELLGTTEGAEMATRASVALHRFSRLKGQPSTAAFPACGMGLDLLHFLQLFPQARARASDLQPLHAAMCQENLRRLGLRAQVLCEDVLHPAWQERVDYAFLDPARRSSGDRRVDLQPPLKDALSWLSCGEQAQIKLAPAFKPHEHGLGDDWSWEWVQLGKEVLECFGTRDGRGDIRATVLEADGSSLGSLALAEDAKVETSHGDDWVSLPAPVLGVAGLLKASAGNEGLEPSPWTMVWRGRGKAPFWESFAILEVLPWKGKKTLKQLEKIDQSFVIRVTGGGDSRGIQKALSPMAGHGEQSLILARQGKGWELLRSLKVEGLGAPQIT